MMDLQDILESIDIVEYISQYVDLEQVGDEWWGLSCFKDEKTPSFSVRQEPPVFFDYSSGIGGNLYTFVRYYNKCSPTQAINILKKYAGIEGEISSPREKMSTTLSCKKFKPPVRREKQDKSTILRDDYMDRYEDRDDKLSIWYDEGISKESVKKFRVKYDSFSDRIVYPILNLDGKIVNIGGRTVDPEWKDKGLRKYCYFYPWGSMNTIYGLIENINDILEKNEIILFEGCKSVLKADSWGIHNTGAILTSHLSVNQLKILAKLGCRVVFALDKDVNIKDDHNIKRLKDYVFVEYLKDKDGILDEKDSPVDKGMESFLKLYEGRDRYR